MQFKGLNHELSIVVTPPARAAPRAARRVPLSLACSDDSLHRYSSRDYYAPTSSPSLAALVHARVRLWGGGVRPLTGPLKRAQAHRRWGGGRGSPGTVSISKIKDARRPKRSQIHTTVSVYCVLAFRCYSLLRRLALQHLFVEGTKRCNSPLSSRCSCCVLCET